MPFECSGSSSRRLKIKSSFSWKGTACRPSRFRRPSWRMAASRGTTPSGSIASGVSPSRPMSTARSVPCPLPVRASEPKSSTRTRPVRSSRPSCSRRSANRRAARIGPTVWELEGPMPMVKRSKTLMAMRGAPPGRDSTRHAGCAMMEGLQEFADAGAGRAHPGPHRAADHGLVSRRGLPPSVRPLLPPPLSFLHPARLCPPGQPRPNPGDLPRDLQGHGDVPARRQLRDLAVQDRHQRLPQAVAPGGGREAGRPGGPPGGPGRGRAGGEGRGGGRPRARRGDAAQGALAPAAPGDRQAAGADAEVPGAAHRPGAEVQGDRRAAAAVAGDGQGPPVPGPAAVAGGAGPLLPGPARRRARGGGAMSHPEPHPEPELLAAYHAGELTEPEERRLPGPLLGCPQGAALLLALDGLSDPGFGAGSLAAADQEALWQGLQTEIRKEEAPGPLAPVVPLRRRALSPSWLPALAAALLAVTIGLSAWVVSLQ